jgi:DNA-binding CsgD family transcriptional regulator
LSQAEREQQIATLLEDGPLPGRELARRVGLGIHTVNAILRQMCKRGELARELRQRYYWYQLAA